MIGKAFFAAGQVNGTNPASSEVRLLVANGGKADIASAAQFGGK